MDPRIAARLELHLTLRRSEASSADSAAHWFYIVDLDATAEEAPHALRDGRVVLGVSATEADAHAAATVDGIGVVYHANLAEADQRQMAAHIDALPHDSPERNDVPPTGGEL